MDFTNISIHIYLLGFLLFLHVGVLKADILTLEMGSLDGTELHKEKSTFNRNISQYFYTYTYSAKNEVMVNIACKANDSETNPALTWQIKAGESHTDCHKKNVRERNYIMKLGAWQKDKNLTCILINSKNSSVAIAKVTFKCPLCKDFEDNTFGANCYNDTDDAIEIYVNGTFKRSSAEITAFKNDVFIIHCIIQADDNHTVELDNISVPSLYLKKFSNSVLAFNATMSDLLDDQMIRCVKKIGSRDVSTASVYFKLKSTLYINITQSGNNRITYRERTDVQYKNNDIIILTCVWDHTGTLYNNMTWTVDGRTVDKKVNSKIITYQATLTQKDDGSNITCETKVNNEVLKSTICLRYVNPGQNKTKSNNETGSTADSTAVTQMKKGKDPNQSAFKWIAIAVAIAVIVVIIIFSAFKYKSWRKRTPNEIYTAPERPVLEPTYAVPVDDANMYAYTYNQKPTQETYSTPFVPTVAEMYAEPIPKASRVKQEPTYPLPGKWTYANSSFARQNPPEPGYSYVSGNTSDTASETYIYSQGLYCRPRQLDSKPTH